MKSKKLKGSVLFTVIAVMMVVLVFVMSALTIAGATNRRAYSDYSKAQTQYTAHAALEATMKYLRDYDVKKYDESGNPIEYRNNALGAAVAGLTKSSDSIKLDVNFSTEQGGANVTDNAVATDGKATVKIKCVNDSYTYTDGKEHSVVVVTASATLAGVTTEESMLLLKDPPKKDLPLGGPNSLTALSAISADSNPFILGGASANIIETDPSSKTINMPNKGKTCGTVVFNNSVSMPTQTDLQLGLGDGLAIFGDLNIANQLHIKTELEEPSDYKLIPYIFIDGKFTADTNVSQLLDEATSLNLYCNQMELELNNTGLNLNGDVFLFGDKDKSGNNIENQLKHQKSSKLLGWASSLTNPSSIGGTKCGGNFYCNSNLTLSSSGNSANYYFEKNLYTKKVLKIEGEKTKVTVDGTLIVNDSLIIDNAVVECKSFYINFPKADSIKILGDNAKLIVNGVTFTKTHGADGKVITDSEFADQYVKNSRPKNIGWTTATEKMKFVNSAELVEDTWFEYPQEFTRAELTGEPDATNSAPSKDNKVVETTVNESLLQYMSFKDSDGDGIADVVDGKKVPEYNSAYFKKWDDVKDIFNEATEYTDGNVPNTNIDISSESSYKDGKLLADSEDTINGIKTIILKGTFNGKIIVIDTGDDENNVVWVYLKNFVGMNKTRIIVKGIGVAKFYSDTDVTFTTGDETGIYTEIYCKKIYCDNKLICHEKPNESQTNEIPNIYIYMDYTKDTTITLNNAIVTAYLFAPNSKLNISATSSSPSTFEYYTENNEKIVLNGTGACPAIIGSAFVGDYSAGNMNAFIYINNSSDGDGGDPTEEKTTWAVLGYQNGNEFIYKD